MPKVKLCAPAQDPIERDFLDAIRRLKDGQPRNKQLKMRQAKGTLKVNFSSVALEAGRARTLIALANGCRYPRVRELIKQTAAGRTDLPTTHSELIARLRMDKADLQEQVKKYKSEVLAHFTARVKAEGEAVREKETAARLRKEIALKGKPLGIVQKDV
ncbi:hypothetical protein J2X54_001645 [Duganella sp. 3397]|uniref:hypothetical protein n=1 Tax=Duganella sp. 3397 TaxID=2817732 RepID=UPI00285FDC2D|nr:hypothetical protein [Duganella sp. 3397]MDR7049197.1 hypothetical protein [Duganella sp. 3397]